MALTVFFISSFRADHGIQAYSTYYMDNLSWFRSGLESLERLVIDADLSDPAGLETIRAGIRERRQQMKKMDFWFRYLEPTMYKKVNGPLPVEWETEVFEKFEKPYKREGAGLTLAALYLDEEHPEKDSLLSLIRASLIAMDTYSADSITVQLSTPSHFYLCNRLFLLNLAAIYTTGFENPDTSAIIPELKVMLREVRGNYDMFCRAFPNDCPDAAYLGLYDSAIVFVDKEPDNYSEFDQFNFIRDYVNPLFTMNQAAIRQKNIRSTSFVDYSLSKTSTSIFDKNLYYGQDAKGIFLRVDDEATLSRIDALGKVLFNDPILSGNNERSCASCHKSGEYFSDTMARSSPQFNNKGLLARNTPSLTNVLYNHLTMLDGKHISLQDQLRDVITNKEEMGGSEKAVLAKIMSCPDYRKAFTALLAATPWETEVTIDHITSAITYYYSKFSNGYSSFDFAMNRTGPDLTPQVKRGFALFMSKAQCATCHFVPQFNGVKPPYVGSEFEVIGVPADTAFTRLSPDKGRYQVNPAAETLNAFRTGSLRNIELTAPYMHNGVFRTLEQVVDFYDAGGGAGRGLQVPNQTLSSDSLHLSPDEKADLVRFLKSLTEKIPEESPITSLPRSSQSALNKRRVGGIY